MSRRHLLAALMVSAIATSLVSCNTAGTSATSPIDLSPPQAPTGLQLVPDARTQRDMLKWNPSASASVSRYDVYSTSTSGGTWTLVGGTVNAATTQITLPDAPQGGREFYRVRAVGTNNVPSAFTPSSSFFRTDWDGSTSLPADDPRHDAKGEL